MKYNGYQLIRKPMIVWFVLCSCLLSMIPAAMADDLPLIAMEGKKIVTGSAVRIRSEPSLQSSVIGRLGLGAVVPATRRTQDKIETGELNDYWYLVKATAVSGWVSGSLLRDFKAENKEEIWFEVIKARLDDPSLSFVDRMSLYGFTQLVARNARDDKWQGALELGQLLALQKSFDGVDYRATEKEPYASWIKQHQEAGRVFHDEVSGEWLVPSTDYWKLADKYNDKRGGDELTWYAANARLGGECEGDISCNLEREKMTWGEYVKRYPYGRYAGVSLKRMSDTLAYILETLEKEPNYFRGALGSDSQSINELEAIIAGANPKLSERAKAFGQIRAINKIFKQ